MVNSFLCIGFIVNYNLIYLLKPYYSCNNGNLILIRLLIKFKMWNYVISDRKMNNNLNWVNPRFVRHLGVLDGCENGSCYTGFNSVDCFF